jgi:hypothetical protein
MIKIYRVVDLVSMSSNDYKMTIDLLRLGCFRLLGITYKKYIEVTERPNGDIVINYE